MTKIDGTNKLAERVRKELNLHGSSRLRGEQLEDACTTVERVFRALAGKAKDVTRSEALNLWTFHTTCQHSEVEEEYTRVGGMRYRVDSTCTRCHAKVGSFTRVGGETARRAIKRRDDWVRLPDEIEGGNDGDGQPEEGEGRPGEGEGQPGEGEGQSDNDDGDGEGGGEPDENEGEGESEEGDDDGEGGDDSDGKEGEGGGGENDEDGEGEGDPWNSVFGRIWNSTLSEEERTAIYHRIAFFKEPSSDAPAALLEYDDGEG